MLGGADDYLRVRLLTRLACAWRSTPERRDQSAMLSQQAVDLARESDDPATLSYALAGRFWATWWPENTGERLAIAEEMFEVAESAGDAERLVDAHLMLYMAYTEIPRMADARRAEESVRRVANELRQPAQLWLGVAPRALVALMAGDYQLAEELLARELQWAEPITWVRDEVSAARMHLYLLRREQGRTGEAEASTRAATEEFPWYPMHRAALANLLLDLDRVAEARAVFDELARDDFRALYRDNEWLLGMSLAAEACARLRDAASATVLYEQLTPFAGRHAVGQPEGSLGAVDRYLGLLAATTGDLESAEEHLADAIRLNEEMGARPWTAHAEHDLGLLLLVRGRPGDRGRVATLFQSALQTARAVGMTALEAGIAAAGHGHGPAFAIPSAEAGGGEAVFRREGEAWAIGRDAVFRLRDAKGLGYLAVLLANPGREFHVLELAAGNAAPSSARVTSRAEASALGLQAETSATGEILDAEAKAAYRERLGELQREIDEAETMADPERAERAQAEIDAITAELSAAFGLGGRSRPQGSTAERARQSVTKAIRDALRRIQVEDPTLGGHLAHAVRTGLYCAYDPDPAALITWRTDAAAV
jgi:tetratricopeptide (TPR) repeat protein